MKRKYLGPILIGTWTFLGIVAIGLNSGCICHDLIYGTIYLLGLGAIVNSIY